MKSERKRMIKVEFGIFQFCRANNGCPFNFIEIEPRCQQCKSFDRFVCYQKEIGELKLEEIPQDKLDLMKKEGWL